MHKMYLFHSILFCNVVVALISFRSCFHGFGHILRDRALGDSHTRDMFWFKLGLGLNSVLICSMKNKTKDIACHR